MTRVPMGLPIVVPAKAGFGNYKSPNIETRYPGIEFSQFTGAEMMAEFERVAQSVPRLRCPDELTTEVIDAMIDRVGLGAGGRHGKRTPRAVVDEFARKVPTDKPRKRAPKTSN